MGFHPDDLAVDISIPEMIQKIDYTEIGEIENKIMILFVSGGGDESDRSPLSLGESARVFVRHGKPLSNSEAEESVRYNR